MRVCGAVRRGFVRRQPHTTCVCQGVEPATVPSLHEALKAGKPVTVEAGGTLADGLLVPTVGSNAFEIAQTYVDKLRPVTCVVWL